MQRMKIAISVLLVVFGIVNSSAQLNTTLQADDPAPSNRDGVELKCPINSFVYWKHGKFRCRTCDDCTRLKQRMVDPCQPNKDSVCECVDGFYYNKLNKICLPFQRCGPGFGVSKQGTPNSNAKCSPCSQGFYSSITSSVSECKEHTDCVSLGLTLLHPGNATSDNTCGTLSGTPDPQGVTPAGTPDPQGVTPAGTPDPQGVTPAVIGHSTILHAITPTPSHKGPHGVPASTTPAKVDTGGGNEELPKWVWAIVALAVVAVVGLIVGIIVYVCCLRRNVPAQGPNVQPVVYHQNGHLPGFMADHQYEAVPQRSPPTASN